MMKTMNNKKSISILGCGWVGKALKTTLEIDGLLVHCLTRDIIANKKAKLYDVDVLVIAIPPKDDYIEVLEKTLENIHKSVQVILLSSISFYDEKALVVEAEKRVQALHKWVVVLRLGGLMGYNRIAGKYTAGKTLANDSGTNYVHRDDVVGIIKKIIKGNIQNNIFDIVAPIQTTKKKIFLQNAEQFGFEKTEFLACFQDAKSLSPDKVCKVLDYTFVKDSVESFWKY